jgi:hypothetical protein
MARDLAFFLFDVAFFLNLLAIGVWVRRNKR